MPLVRPTALLAAACALVAGSVTQATANQIQADNVRRAGVLTAEANDAVQHAEVAYHARLDAATTARLSAQATAYLAGRRTEARERALGAIETAGQLTAAGTDVLSQDDLAALDQAVADLTDLLATTPDAQVALDDAVARAGTATVEPTVKDVITLPDVHLPMIPTADLLPVTPLGDALELVGAAPAPTAVEPSSGADSGRAATPGRAAAAAASGGAVEPRAAASGAPTQQEPASTPLATRAASGREQTPDPGTVGAPAALTPADDAVAAATVLATVDLDLDASERLSEVAQRVMDLSAQVQATLDATLVAMEEQRAMQAKAAADAARVASLVRAADGSPNGAIPEKYLCHVGFNSTVLLRCDAALALESLDRAYREQTGHHLAVVSSYRTVSNQEVLFTEKGELAAAPGTSNHGRGLAIDLAGAGDLGQYDSPVYQWLKAHAQTYGWHHPAAMEADGPGPYEPWHWEFGTRD
jgi:LAS superfamily LD-carboxypeptidase LdcB